MKKVQWLALFVMTTLMAGAAYAEDMDVQSLKAKLEAQQAEMRDIKSAMLDLQAKVAADKNSEAPTGELISINKNAKVTIGGTINTRYAYRNAKVDSNLERVETGGTPQYEYRSTSNYTHRASDITSDLLVEDAKLAFQIDVNDNFDAYLQLDLRTDRYGAAEKAYVRWKNICNTGFNLKIGRDDMVFGEEGVGVLDTFTSNHGDGLENFNKDNIYVGQFPTLGVDNFEELRFGMVPPHNMWDISSVDQVTASWEGLNGKLGMELSLMQKVTYLSGIFNNDRFIYPNGEDKYHFRSRNYGFGSMSARVRYMPIEGLKLSASLANFHDRGVVWEHMQTDATPERGAKNNSALSLAVNYRPTVFPKVNLWGQWIHGWNVANLKNLSSDVLNLGVSYDLTDKLTAFAQGEYLRTAYNFDIHSRVWGWSSYVGLQYKMDYGLNLEAGWRHEALKYYKNGLRFANSWADTIYAQVGFDF